MKIWYLYHSAFAVETARHILIFDYFCDQPQGGGLEQGVIDPAELAAKGKPVVVFVSHEHGDHYSPVIFRWRETLPDVRYLLAQGVPAQGDCLTMGPGERLALGDLTVETLRSNDLGVAWYLQVDGQAIYHAGDLHWWRWEGEPEDWNDQMEWSYKGELAKLAGRPVDVAFVPLDPRQQQNYRLGMDWLVQALHPRYLFPMHFEDQPQVTQQLQEDAAAASYRDRVAVIHRRGEAFTLPDPVHSA